MSSPLAGVAAINAITFGVYGNALRCMEDQESVKSVTMAGMTAGIVQVLGYNVKICIQNRVGIHKGQMQMYRDIEMRDPGFENVAGAPCPDLDQFMFSDLVF